MDAYSKTIGRFCNVRGQSNGLMLGLSVALHGAIALLPLQVIPKQPKEPVLESFPPITVTRLPENLLSNPNISPNNSKPDNSAESQPAILQPVPSTPATPQPVSPRPVEPVVIPSPVPQPLGNQSTVDAMVTPENTAAENTAAENITTGNIATENTAEIEGSNQQLPESNDNSDEASAAEMAAIWDGFLGSLPSGLAQSNLQQILNLFGQLGQEELFFDANQRPKTSVVNHYLLEDKTPQQVFDEFVYPQFSDQKDFEIQVYGEFAGGPVYQIMQEGEVAHYLNIVPLNAGSGSVLIVGDRPPVFDRSIP